MNPRHVFLIIFAVQNEKYKKFIGKIKVIKLSFIKYIILEK